MSNIITSAILAVVIVAGLIGYNSGGLNNLGAFGDPFLSIQLATSPSNGDCLTTDGTNNSWDTCAAGGGGSGTVSTSSIPSISHLAYWTTSGANTELLSSVATTTLTATSPLSLSQAVVKVGGSNSVLTIATTTNSLFTGAAGQVLAYLNGGWTGAATTTFSGGLTYSGGNVTNTLTAGDGITRNTDDLDCDTASGSVFGCLASADWTTFNNKQDTITAGDALTLTGTDIDFDGGTAPSGELGGTWGAVTIDDSLAVTSWNLTTPTLTSFFGTPCTGNEFLQDIGDTGTFTCAAASGGAGGLDFSYSQNIGFGVTGSATTTKTQFTLGIHASSTSQFNNATSTLLTATTAWVTNLFIGADTLAEYISDTAGAFFTGNTETGVTVTYQDADNTVDVVCNTADTSTFGCLTDTDWDTFNNKQATITAGDALTLTGTDIDFDGGTAPAGSLGGTWASPTIDDLFLLNNGDVGTGVFDFGGTTSFEITNGTGPTVDAAGEIAIDTTTGQLITFDGTNKDVYQGERLPVFGISTTTTWTATTTMYLGPAGFAQTWNTIRCETDAGFIGVSVYDGTNRMNYFVASTTIGTVTLSTNNTFTLGESRRVDFGTTTTSVAKAITCTGEYDITAD